MDLETKIVIIGKIEELPDVDINSRASEKFTGVSMINLVRAGEECNEKAIAFAKKGGYDVVYRKTMDFAGEFTAISEYDFYRLKESSAKA